MAMHLLSEFNGQAFPEQVQTSIGHSNIDRPLATELLNRWLLRFSGETVEWKDRVIFRALNMANEAGRLPALTAGVFYDAGRSLALWVSACEILAHPGGTGQSNFPAVCALLERVKWIDAKLAAKVHIIHGRPPQKGQLANWVCRKIYDLRNDFLHGNDVAASALTLKDLPILDFAACLFRLALTGFLDLHFNVPMPPKEDAEAIAAFINQRAMFNKFQRAFEDALSAAV